MVAEGNGENRKRKHGNAETQKSQYANKSTRKNSALILDLSPLNP
jgi:hypothetical protein